MIKNKNINKIFESWGKNKQETPLNNDVLKTEFLSKIPMDLNDTVSPRRSPFVWLPVAFSAMAVFVLLFNMAGYPKFSTVGISEQNNDIQVEAPMGFFPASDSYNKSSGSATMPYPYYREDGLSIADQREFLKVGYNATLQTRHVADLKAKVEMIVRGLDGRVDASNSSEKYGYVSFAIPKNELEIFKMEIKDLVGERFYFEQTNSQNLLPQKQMIEENQRQNQNNLNSLQIERGQIVKNHNQNISSFWSRINSNNTEINALNLEYQSANSKRRGEILNRISQLQTEINIINSEIANENKSYQTKISNLDAQIKNIQNNLGALQIQDNNLLDDVATVNGSISLNWISLWKLADAYLPGPLSAWILFAVAFLSFLWYRFFVRVSYNSFDFS